MQESNGGFVGLAAGQIASFSTPVRVSAFSALEILGGELGHEKLAAGRKSDVSRKPGN